MIVITGMHRSGTSFTASLTRKIGLDLGPEDKLHARDKWNEKGYFENTDVLNLNNKIILGDHITDQYWLLPYHIRGKFKNLIMSVQKSKYLLFPNQNTYAKRAAARSGEIKFLSDLYDDIAVKDPRFSLLIEYWYKYGHVNKILYCFRHPYEAAASIKKREKLPGWLGYKVWLYHVDIFFEQIRKIRPDICFVDFNNFFSPDKGMDEVRRLYAFMGKTFDAKEASETLSSVLDHNLKRNIHARQNLPEPVEERYRFLLSCHERYDTPRMYDGQI